MPKGDAQRVWFPEMLARLQREWRETMSVAALIDLRDSLDTLLHQIRSERHISSPVFTCPQCGLRGPMAEPRVSVRAMILALGRFGIALPAKTKALDSNESGPDTERSKVSISTARVCCLRALPVRPTNAAASRALLLSFEYGKPVYHSESHQIGWGPVLILRVPVAMEQCSLPR